MWRITVIVPLLLLIYAGPAQAELSLRPVHPHETFEYTFDTRFSLDTAITCLESVRNALKSFRELTEAAEGKVPKKTLKEIGNTDWDFQNIGFRNWPGILEGTLRKQEYLIKKLQYELLREQAGKGRAGDRELSKAREDFEKAEKAFQSFWNGFGVSD
jgi:hypothetical protein